MIYIERTEHVVYPDASRVVARPFFPGTPNFGGPVSRLDAVVARVIDTPPGERAKLLAMAGDLAAGRHRDIEVIWRRHFAEAAGQSRLLEGITDPELVLLVGAFLTQDYAYEAAALTNPSIVPVGEVDDNGSAAFIMSARAIGEGHISSITFLSGRVDGSGNISLDPRSPYATNGDRQTPVYDKAAFAAKLAEFGADNEIAQRVLGELEAAFTAGELEVALGHVRDTDIDRMLAAETLKRIHWLATSNYILDFDTADVTERLISPAGPAESHGMEDARFVRFRGDDGDTFVATYTAFDGIDILPQLIETRDFTRFRISTLSGPMAHNKGIALFPRKIDGLYVALSRHDQESTFVMRTENLREWRNAELAFRPERGWEAVQGGNCGSPLETTAGWLVITHGVGPMRRYALGAVLLDLEEPAKVVGRLPGPLLEPVGEERVGYVPNVVYSCGSMIHGGRLIVPYGFGDRAIRIATTSLEDLLAAMV